MPAPAADGHMRRKDLQDVIRDAVEASEYLEPDDPGLTVAEIELVAGATGFHSGEVREEVARSRRDEVILSEARPGRFVVGKAALATIGCWRMFEGDVRNVATADHVWSLVLQAYRSKGHPCRLGREYLVACAASDGHSQADVAVAIRCFVRQNLLTLHGDAVELRRGAETFPLPSTQVAQFGDRPAQRSWFPSVYVGTRDVVRRRTDGRCSAPEPIVAFEDVLDRSRHARFLSWWRLTAAELAHADAHLAPTTAVVLSAALVEAALCFVVESARSSGRSFARLEENPRQWKLQTLVGSACSGPEPIFDARLRERALALNAHRQRIHAGYLLDAYANDKPIPDLRPEEVRESRATLDAVLRRLLDWYPRPAR